MVNPSFEDTVSCPYGLISYSTGWDSYGLSPDCFNPCSGNPDFSVPNNWGGFQQPASGSAYTAFGTYLSHKYGTDIREFIGGQLSSPLVKNTKYYVSFKVALSLDDGIFANCASNKIGAMFSTVSYSSSNPAPITNNPAIYTNTIITDTTNWTRIFGSFVADSTYQRIIIGNFFNDANTDTLIMNSSIYCDFAYYYLDDVCVSTDSTYTSNWTAIKDNEELNKLIKIYPNPASDFINVNLNTEAEMKIYNLLGVLLFEAILKEKTNKFDIAYLPKGIYLVVIEYKEERYTQQLAKL